MILRERPAASQQDIANRDFVLACANCHRFIGTVGQQIEHLTGTAVPADLHSAQILSPVVRCSQGILRSLLFDNITRSSSYILS